MIEVEVGMRLGAFQLDASFSVPAHGVTALFGRSGAGKTSVVNAIAGLTRPDQGRITVADRVFFDAASGIDLPPEKRGVGYVFQHARLFPHLSVAGNLDYGYRRARGSRVIERPAVIDALGLGPLLKRAPYHLSGGERQRVALGRALLAQPRLLLLDEPLASLDALRKVEVLPYIERLVTEFKLPALYVSHAIDEITRLADHLVLLNEGRTVTAGTLAEVMANPEYAPLVGRFEAGAVLDCTVRAHDQHYHLTTLAFADGELKVPLLALAPGAAVRARLRARDVALALEEPRDFSMSNRLVGTVQTLVVREATYVDVAVTLGATVVRALVTRESADRLRLAPGVRVWVLVKSVALDSRAVGFTRRVR